MDFNVFTVSFEIESPSVVIVHQILGTILYCSKKLSFLLSSYNLVKKVKFSANLISNLLLK